MRTRLRTALVAALIIVAALPASGAAAGAGGDVTVPVLIDVRLDKALKTLKKADLKSSHHDAVRTKQRSRGIKSRWRVIAQDPPPGAVVPAGTIVKVGARHGNDLSWPGQPPVPVPNVIGLRLDKAKKTLTKAYLRSESFDAVRADGPRKQKNNKNWTVTSQDPPGEATTSGGTLVRLGVRHKKDPTEQLPPLPPNTTPVETTTPPPAVALPAVALPAVALPAGDDTSVTRIIDGDTIETSGGTRIRFIGVDTPETKDCFGSEATAHTSQLIPPGTKLRLAYDVERTDRYGRTLAYLYRLSDGLFINAAIAHDGYAQQLTIPPNVAHAEDIRQAIDQARTAGRGLWAGCAAPAPPAAPAAAPRPTIPKPTATTAAPSPGGRCHPSYRGACVPIAEDVDCAGGSGNGPAYVNEKDIQVVGPDEYGLDGNNNGIGCESRP